MAAWRAVGAVLALTLAWGCVSGPPVSKPALTTIALCGAGLQRSSSVDFSVRVSDAARSAGAGVSASSAIRAAFLTYPWPSADEAQFAYRSYVDCVEGRVNIAALTTQMAEQKPAILAFLSANNAPEALRRFGETYIERRTAAIEARDFVGERRIRGEFFSAMRSGLPDIPFSRIPDSVLQSKGFAEMDARSTAIGRDIADKRAREVARYAQLCALFGDADSRQRCAAEARISLAQFDRRAERYRSLCGPKGDRLPPGFAKTPDDVHRYVAYRRCACLNTSSQPMDACPSPLGW